MKVDRSFATPAPPCLHSLTRQGVDKGRSWGDLAVDVAKLTRDRSICLEEVAKWYAAERDARTTGAPGA